MDYALKFETIVKGSLFHKLTQTEQHDVKHFAHALWLSQNELKILCDIAVDFTMWDEPSICIYINNIPKATNKKATKKNILKQIDAKWNTLKNTLKTYPDIAPKSPQKFTVITEEKNNLGLGLCPVGSEKTRCCNLITLDAVEGCGFDCSYCSIQTFYKGGSVATFDSGFKAKIDAIELDPEQIYHIGTGQASDSLLWGNKNNMLDILCNFAQKNPKLILEMKTKSKNISYFLENDAPKNILFTWSLNPQTIIDNEEHFAASLDERLNAAKALHDKGHLIGFHFHPMFYYEGWEDDYKHILKRLTTEFKKEQVALISLGTLTFIKPVIKTLRARGLKSKVLQMPLVEADGKLSYSDDIKIKMFSLIYDNLTPWHDDVFFYMCMENQRFWEPVFGHEYANNVELEVAMKDAYYGKIEALRGASI